MEIVVAAEILLRNAGTTGDSEAPTCLEGPNRITAEFHELAKGCLNLCLISRQFLQEAEERQGS